jgi:hypothetical protein
MVVKNLSPEHIDQSLALVNINAMSDQWPDLCLDCKECMRQLEQSVAECSLAIKDKNLMVQVSALILNQLKLQMKDRESHPAHKHHTCSEHKQFTMAFLKS